MRTPDITIHERLLQYDDDIRMFLIESPYGTADTTFIEPPGWYNIAGVDVPDHDNRGKGHGQELLRATLDHARALGATTIVAAIISRECLEAMERVFDEGISVTRRGDPTPQGEDYNRLSPTTANLWLELK